jgi:hypothetical protein
VLCFLVDAEQVFFINMLSTMFSSGCRLNQRAHQLITQAN